MQRTELHKLHSQSEDNKIFVMLILFVQFSGTRSDVGHSSTREAFDFFLHDRRQRCIDTSCPTIFDQNFDQKANEDNINVIDIERGPGLGLEWMKLQKTTQTKPPMMSPALLLPSADQAAPARSGGSHFPTLRFRAQGQALSFNLTSATP